MSRIAWASPPYRTRTINLPDPPQTENPAVNEWLQKAKFAIDQLSQPEPEMLEFLNDVLNTIKELDRDSINALSAVSETAGGTYTANEQAMLTSLKTLANGLRTNL